MRTDKRQVQPRPLAAGARTAERIGEIVEAAERAAQSVLDDAEEQGRRYLDEVRAEADREVAERRSAEAEMLDSLLEQAEALRAQAERMVDALERAKAELAPEPEVAAEPGSERLVALPQRGSHLAAVADPEEERSNYAGARLLATQMAVSGSSREEIELRLRNGFEIDDPAAILNAILGPED